jgi:hypothetical protein
LISAICSPRPNGQRHLGGDGFQARCAKVVGVRAGGHSSFDILEEIGVPMYSAETDFLRKLAKLEASVRFVDAYFDTLPQVRIERDLNTAKAFLSHLWQKIQSDNIDPYRVYPTLMDIEFRLRSLQSRADARCIEPSFWASLRSALNVAINIINLVTSMIGLGPFVPRIPALPSTKVPALLESRSSFEIDVGIDVTEFR